MLFDMEFLLVFVVVSSSLLEEKIVDAANDKATIETHNPLTAFKQCSNGDKEWHICHGYSEPELYCPTVLESNSSQFYYPCFTCPDAESDCETVVSHFLKSQNISEDAIFEFFTAYNISEEDANEYYGGNNIADLLFLSCRKLCESGKKGDACWTNLTRYSYGDSCTAGSHFCDFASDDDFAMNISGTCKACPLKRDECYEEGFVTSLQGKRNCASCTLHCNEDISSSLIVNGDEFWSSPIMYAIQKSFQNASGSLVDCSELLLETENVCQGAEGHVCIVDYSILGDYEVGKREWQLSDVAEDNGCVAIVGINVYGYFWHYFDELSIPFIKAIESPNQSLIFDLNDVARIEVQLFGSRCYFSPYGCNMNLPCGESEFCSYASVVVNDTYTEGYCDACPTFDNGEPDPAGCFFDRMAYSANFSYSTPEAVESCAKACNATLVSDDCKFCPSSVSAFDFGVENKADQCFFCPKNDVQYPDKFVPLFGKNITCWMIQTFFKRMEVHKDSPNCRLVQSMNYMCGCDGTGYAGANTYTKQVVLVWLPRVAAILSIVGSLFIIYDTWRSCHKRAKLMNQLLSTLSVFDILGSTAYALTTLPTPESDELYGAKGNDQSCIAQGFFIQIGTIACLLNVSLAIYYLLTIKYGWSEERFKRNCARCFLFFPPIVFGLVYAFVSIPHYGNVRVWCNNSAKWWPEIPVILAVIAGTGIMGTLCHHVYKIETRTAQYTDIAARLSMKVFKQSCWFVIAFYITWVPYITLQYMLSSGTGYDNYGLILIAATLVPLQGFWNNFVYIRPRYLSKIAARVFSSIRYASSLFQRSSKTDTAAQSAVDSLQQSGPHDQLQVVHVYENVAVSSLDVDCNSANPPKEKETDDETLEITHRENLDQISDDVDGGALKGFSHLCENNSMDSKGNVAMRELPRVSTHKNFEFIRK